MAPQNPPPLPPIAVITLSQEIEELEKIRTQRVKAFATWVAANQMSEEEAAYKKRCLDSTISRLKCMRVLLAGLF